MLLTRNSKLNLLFCCFLFFVTTATIEGSLHLPSSRTTKVFVFGDSYADTGNVPGSWKQPYGLTFPGKPAGRFSDGRVLTDYFVKIFGLKTPIAYMIWLKLGINKFQDGMNFAFGGSGVFFTYNNLRNMTTQIDFLENLVNNGTIYTKRDLKSSVALVSLAGNDYGAFLTKGGSFQGLQHFVPKVVNQLAVNLKRLNEMGVKKIAVTGLPPIGCLPVSTVSFKQCNASFDFAVDYHNLLLRQAVATLNNQTKQDSIFIIDLYNSFMTMLNREADYPGELKFETPLKPCCRGINSGFSCGDVDENGTRLYTVCNDPKSAFFWDSDHPTDAGWSAVYMLLKSSLVQFFVNNDLAYRNVDQTRVTQ